MLKRKSHRPPETWYIPKAINDVDRIIDAVIAIEDLDGERWTQSTSEETGTQTELQQMIKDAGIYGGTPSDMAGRNWMATFQFFGFAYVERPDRVIRITPAGKSLKGNTSHHRDIVMRQFLKLQFPNPYQVRHMSEKINIVPFWSTLKVIKELEYVTEAEVANYVLWMKETDEILDVVKSIRKSREKGLRNRADARTMELLNDYASRLRLYFTYTALIEDDGSHDHNLTLNEKQMTHIDRILSTVPTVDLKFSDTSLWNEWFDYYGSTPKPYRTITGKMTKAQYRARVLSDFLSKVAVNSHKIKVKISKVGDATRMKYGEIVKLLSAKPLYNEFPILERAEISGNDIIIHQQAAERKKISGFSKKAAGFLHIIYDSTHSDDYENFEEDVQEIFESLQFKVERLGVKKSGLPLPDLIVKSDQGHDPGKYWACLVDAKSRTNGFDIGKGSRRAMKEYAASYAKTVSGSNPFPLKSLLFVSSYFVGDVDSKLKEVQEETDQPCSCISAKNLLSLLDLYLNHPGKITHDKLLALLTSGSEITKQMIDTLLTI